MIECLFIIALVSLIVYLYFLLRFFIHLKTHQKLNIQHEIPVSIICSARNEEENIAGFIDSIIKQNYSKELIQLIIVDDQSTDKTYAILDSYKDKLTYFEYFTAIDREKYNSPKKNALSQAILRAKHELILTSDADCLPSPDWVNGMVDIYVNKPNTDMVIGFSQTIIDQNEKKFFKRFEHFDFHVLMFALGGSVNSGKYFTCSGQNLSYKRSSFESVGGFSTIMHLISGDDLHLMQLFRKNKMKIEFADNLDSHMKTRPVKSMLRLFNQRSRWASNMKLMLISNPEFFIYLSSTFFLLTLIPVLLFLDTKRAIALAIIKISFDLIYITKGYKCFGLENRLAKDFIGWTLFQPIYTLIIGILGSVSLFKWKDRKGFKS